MSHEKTNLFIVGAAKAGTTSVFNYLKLHPQIFGCPIKEPNYFGSDIQWENFRSDYKKSTYLNMEKYLAKKSLRTKHNTFISSSEHYEELFRDAEKEKYIMEASTSYLYSRNAAREIKAYNSNAKIIIILRDPVERTISHYKMGFVSGIHKESNIMKEIKTDYEKENKGYGISNLYLELSLYYAQLKRYFKTFDQTDILVLRFEQLTKNRLKFMNSIYSFLDISAFSKNHENSIHNRTRGLRFGFLKNLTVLKSILPEFVINYLQSQNSFLYKKSLPISIDEYEKKYIYSYLREDWEKTKKLLNNHVNH